MKPRPLVAVGALTVVLLLGACAGEPSEPATVTVTETVAAAPASEPAVETTAPEAPADPEAVAVGSSVTRPDGWKITAYQVDDDPTPDSPAPDAPGTKWWAADVEACNPDVEGAGVTTDPWRVVDTANRQYESSGTSYSSFPAPLYGSGGGTPLSPGECTRGWIVFVVGVDAELVSLSYQPVDAPSPLVWTL